MLHCSLALLLRGVGLGGGLPPQLERPVPRPHRPPPPAPASPPPPTPLPFARCVPASASGAPIAAATGLTIAIARSTSARATVNVRSVSPPTLAFCTIGAALIPPPASGS